MTSSDNSRFEKRDLILASITAIIGAAAVTIATIGIVALSRLS